MSYLVAGCPALVGNLWTVTTMDLDVETERIVDWIMESATTPSQSLLHVIPLAKMKSKLRFINGASLVYYGLPIYKSQQCAAFSSSGATVQKSSSASLKIKIVTHAFYCVGCH